MASTLKGRHLKSTGDFSGSEIEQIFLTTQKIKSLWAKGVETPFLKGKVLGMLFEKSSTRTRVSFEVGIFQLGGIGLYLSTSDLQVKRGETIADTARVLSRYVNALMARTYAHQTIEDLAQYSYVPVINGLSDLLHPCQALTDFYTVYEKRGNLKGLKFVYVGDGNNVANSLMLLGAQLGVEVTICCPEAYKPDPGILSQSLTLAKNTKAKIEIIEDPLLGCLHADVIYTDTWVSMGQEKERESKVKVFSRYQVNQELLAVASKDVLVMHCLPAHRGEEITDEVMDGPHSIVFDQAENRLHTQKGIMTLLLLDINL